jgi:uncharacterized protein YqhQ
MRINKVKNSLGRTFNAFVAPFILAASGEVLYGGQAVINGVMMRGEKNWAVAVRKEDGSIAIKTEPLKQAVYTHPFFKLPFVRGVVILIEALHLGVGALLWSASERGRDNDIELSKRGITITLAISLTFSISLFFGVPLLISYAVQHAFGLSSLGANLVDGVVRAALLFGYLGVIRLMPDVKIMWGYHGAEHKSIHNHEAHLPLEVINARTFSRIHPRCGTTFMVLVVLVSVVVFSAIGRPSIAVVALSRIVLVPVIAGIAYEILRFGANHRDNILLSKILLPTRVAQLLTTSEPSDEQLEVAIAALKEVVPVVAVVPDRNVAILDEPVLVTA